MQSTTDALDLVADLERATEEYERRESAVETVGEDTIERVGKSVDRMTTLLDKYADRATGTGDFKAFVQFKGQMTAVIEELPDDLPRRDAFEAAKEAIDKRRLDEGDFERAREALEPARNLAGRIDDRSEARSRFRDARRDVFDRVETVEDRIDELERVRALGEADLDAPVSELRTPIEAYNERITDAFDAFFRETSARAFFEFLDTAALYPLVPFPSPPEDLREYLTSHEAGTEPIPTLIEYADYSRSKLDHYVEDATALKRNVATRRTFLERLDAGPLVVDWPPPDAETLRWRADELVSVAGRVAPDEAIARLRTVRDLSRDEDEYERLRRAAVARDELGDDRRRQLERGEIERELDRLREERDRLRDALAEHAIDDG